MFRSKMKWFELGEKPTKFFFNLEKRNYEKKLIREVELENGEIISDPVQVNKEIRNFYQNMYTSKINGNSSTSAYEQNQKIDGFTQGLNIPQLNVEEQESLEKDLTLEELKDALASFADKNSPGEDGFTNFLRLDWKRPPEFIQRLFSYRIFVNYTEKRINNTYPKR